MLITNYITSAWRNILRHKLFSIINIMGLAIGLAAVMLIGLYVKYETSYDSFWKNADNIYRLHIEFNEPGQERQLSFPTPPPVIVAMKNSFPEIKAFTRMQPREKNVVYGDKTFTDVIDIVDQGVVDVFDFNVVAGDIKNALKANNGIILNETLANKYFGDEDPIGKILYIDMGDFQRDYIVNAVIEDMPKNSKLLNTAMVPIFAEDWEKSGFLKPWYARRLYTYFSLNDGASIDNLITKLPDFIDRNFPPPPFGDAELKPSSAVSLTAMNIKDLHLNAKGFGNFTPPGSKTTVIIFSIVAFSILLIATINYMNLSTARASMRAMEVSLRKVMGAKRKNLIVQFIGESMVMAILAMLIAISMVEVSLPYYSELVSTELTIHYEILELTSLLFLTLTIGLIGGIYPAFVLSNFRPSTVLKSNHSSQDNVSSKIRGSLVIFQFTISIILFVSTAVIYNQLNHIKNIELGFNKDNLLTLYSVPFGKIDAKLDVFKSRLTRIDNVSNMTWTRNFSPGLEGSSLQSLRTDQSAGNRGLMMSSRGVGYDFFKTWEIPIIAGRTFDENRNDERATAEEIATGNDHVAAMIVTEIAAEKLGLGTPEQAIGKMVYLNTAQSGRSNASNSSEIKFSVIGVASNIQLHNFKETSDQPEFFHLRTRNPFAINLRFSGDPMKIIEEVGTIWDQELPDTIFEYELAEDAIAKQYTSEQNQMVIFSVFSGLAIFIACLGLFGLASFTAERRTKEIGIRKVFGAEIWQIIKLLVWQFSKPVLISNFIAWPIAYLAMSRWLESFVYRIDDMVIIALCLIAGLTALLIAWATVAGNSYAVARQNPIKALRYE